MLQQNQNAKNQPLCAKELKEEVTIMLYYLINRLNLNRKFILVLLLLDIQDTQLQLRSKEPREYHLFN